MQSLIKQYNVYVINNIDYSSCIYKSSINISLILLFFNLNMIKLQTHACYFFLLFVFLSPQTERFGASFEKKRHLPCLQSQCSISCFVT